MFKSFVAFVAFGSFMLASPASAQTTIAWDPQTTDTSVDSDFDFAEQLFASVSASNITFNGANSSQFHDHGNPAADFIISLLIDGTYQTVFTGTSDTFFSSLGTINFSGGQVTGLRLASTQYVGNAFHGFSTSNVFTLDGQVSGAVPEPSTWAMMLFGFGAIGVSLRRRRRVQELLQAA